MIPRQPISIDMVPIPAENIPEDKRGVLELFSDDSFQPLLPSEEVFLYR